MSIITGSIAKINVPDDELHRRILEHGCNSGTAYGDGAVDLFYRTNDKDEVIEAVYHYNLICDEDE